MLAKKIAFVLNVYVYNVCVHTPLAGMCLGFEEW